MSEITNTMLKLEQEFISTIKDKTLCELSEMLEQPLENLTALADIFVMLENSGIKYMFSNEEFLNMPIKAHYSYNERDIFLITEYPLYKEYVPLNRAISVTDGYCKISYHAEMPENEVKDSNFKTVRDILQLIDFDEE